MSAASPPGSFLDKKTGAHDLGFGLHIMDFLLAPGWRDDGYQRDPKLHGNLPKHYVEGPQICTQAKQLKPEMIRGKDFVAVKLRFTYNKPAKGFKAGSTWEQTLVFQPGVRYFLSCEKITSANDVDDLFYRIDMPGHIKHKNGDTFEHVYLSYLDKPIPASEFKDNFGPDEKFLYQRDDKKIPERMIRAYQVKVDGKPGPWLAGMTLDPAETSRPGAINAATSASSRNCTSERSKPANHSAPPTSSAGSMTFRRWKRSTTSTRGRTRSM